MNSRTLRTLDKKKADKVSSRTVALAQPQVPIPLFKVFMSEDVMAPLRATLMSGYIGQGPRVEEFEQRLTPWFGNPNVLAVSSGTASLHLALRLANVGPGDEVISTAMTCSATNSPILERGASIVWADIDPCTGNIDSNDVERKITSRTKAILAVHWGGYPCDLTELNAIARKHGIKVIEDAAHAFGATYKNAPIGSHSDFVCFSFQAIKHLTTVDGGALVCRSKTDYDRGKLLRWFGIDREGARTDFRCENDIAEYGYKFHMNDVAATIGISQLRHVESILDRHRDNAEYYRKNLRDVRGVTLLDYKDDRRSAYWLFTIRVAERLRFMAAMKDRGVTVSQVHSRNDTHSAFKEFHTELAGVTEFCRDQVSIPVGWWINDEQRKYIVESIKKSCKG